MYKSVYEQTPLSSRLKKFTKTSPLYSLLQSLRINDGLLYTDVDTNTDDWRTWNSNCFKVHQYISESLSDRLLELRLLQHVPLAYLVPDPALLPVESIRFFHVDQAWTDRLIEGVLSAANIGTADLGYSVMMHYNIRAYLDERLNQKFKELGGKGSWAAGTNSMTGMLIRSELVRRWPEMLVNAFSQETDPDDSSKSDIPILRKDLISKNIMIVIFAGNPKRIEIREPACGTRFGVDINDNSKKTVNRRDYEGKEITENQPMDVIFNEKNVLNIDVLTKNMTITRKIPIELFHRKFFIEIPYPYWKEDKSDTRTEPGARDVAIHLSQPPYVQVFRSDRPEQYGAFSTKLNLGRTNDGLLRIPLRNGRFFDIQN